MAVGGETKVGYTREEQTGEVDASISSKGGKAMPSEETPWSQAGLRASLRPF